MNVPQPHDGPHYFPFGQGEFGEVPATLRVHMFIDGIYDSLPHDPEDLEEGMDEIWRLIGPNGLDEDPKLAIPLEKPIAGADAVVLRLVARVAPEEESTPRGFWVTAGLFANGSPYLRDVDEDMFYKDRVNALGRPIANSFDSNAYNIYVTPESPPMLVHRDWGQNRAHPTNSRLRYRSDMETLAAAQEQGALHRLDDAESEALITAMETSLAGFTKDD